MTVGNVRRALVLAAGALIAVACSGAPAPTPAGTPAVTLTLVAQSSAFEPRELAVIADAPFAIRFENRDSIPHNVSIQGPQKMTGETFIGPATRTITFAGLPPGTYTLICEIHLEMRGTIVSQ